MLLQTQLIDRLAIGGLKVAIVSQDPDDVNLSVFANQTNVTLVKWHTKSNIWDDNYLHKRMYYLENIDENAALKEKFYNGLFFSKSKHPWKRIRPLWYYIMYRLIKYFPAIRTRFSQKEDKHLKSKEACEILHDINPRLVIATYPVSIIEAKVLHEATNLGIPTLLQLLSWDNITTKGKFPVIAERFIVWGEIMKTELQRHYNVTPELISICGVPHFDEHIKVRETQDYKPIIDELGISAQRPYLFFAMSSPRFAPREIDIVEWLSNAVNDDFFGEDMQLVVRPHPQNVQSFMAKESWLGRLDKLSNDRVAVDYPTLNKSALRWSMQHSDMIRLAKIMSGCAVCLNSGSTISIEALLQNKPVILTSFDGHSRLPYWNSARRLVDYTHLKKLVNMRGVRSVSSYIEMKQTIQDFLANPDKDLDDRRKTVQAQCYKDDGHATDRVIDSIIATLKQIA